MYDVQCAMCVHCTMYMFWMARLRRISKEVFVQSVGPLVISVSHNHIECTNEIIQNERPLYFVLFNLYHYSANDNGIFRTYSMQLSFSILSIFLIVAVLISYLCGESCVLYQFTVILFKLNAQMRPIFQSVTLDRPSMIKTT